MEVPDADVERILTSLGFEVVPSPSMRVRTPSAGMWSAPPWRIDIHRQVDLIEEVGRHYGFEHLPTTFPGVEQAPPPSDPRIARDRKVRTALLGMGFSEAITFAFIEAAAAEPYLGGDAPVTIANPLSEKFTVMRPSLLPGLVDAVSHNRRHGRPDVRLFEIGTRFSPNGETRGAGFAWTGLATRRSLERRAARGGLRRHQGRRRTAARASSQVRAVRSTEVETPYLVSGRAAAIVVNGETIGVLRPAVAGGRREPRAARRG